jgi:hypothetical protein
MLTIVQEYVMNGEITMSDEEMGFLSMHGLNLEEDLGAMAEDDFVIVPEGDEIKLELFAAHFLVMLLKLDADLLLEL